MASTRDVQAAIMAHKRRMGFNTTDIHRETCLTMRELAELHEAIDKGRDDEAGGELADVAIGTSGDRAARSSGCPDTNGGNGSS